MKIIPEEWIIEPNENGDGLLQGFTADTSTEFPLCIETHNVGKDEVTMNKEQSFSFIFEALPDVKVFESKDVYDDDKKNIMASESLIPCGLFPADSEDLDDFVKYPTAIVTGVVNDVVEDPCAFEFDKTDILYSIDCLDWDINCVIHRANNEVENLKVGNIVQGVFIVQGWPEE